MTQQNLPSLCLLVTPPNHDTAKKQLQGSEEITAQHSRRYGKTKSSSSGGWNPAGWSSVCLLSQMAVSEFVWVSSGGDPRREQAD